MCHCFINYFKWPKTTAHSQTSSASCANLMHLEKLKELHDKNLITEEQFANLELIISKKLFSVFYELRSLLYLGVLLFTTGVGILIYLNIGDLGHLLSIIALCVVTLACFFYAFKKASQYSNSKVNPPTPYFDYIVLLGCLLFILVLGYLQFQYNILDESLGETTLVTAVIFFLAAYRFDHLGVLSLAITAFASFWGLSVSPQEWYHSDFFITANLHVTAMFFGAGLAGIALILNQRGIKQHFTFTYFNFCSLIFLAGALAGIFINEDSYAFYLLLLYSGCALTAYEANREKSFLFLLYAFVFGYIGTTYFLVDFILDDPFIWFFYMLASCGGFVYFIIHYKSYFKREA